MDDDLSTTQTRLREELHEALERDRLGMPRGAALKARIEFLCSHIRKIRSGHQRASGDAQAAQATPSDESR